MQIVCSSRADVGSAHLRRPSPILKFYGNAPTDPLAVTPARKRAGAHGASCGATPAAFSGSLTSDFVFINYDATTIPRRTVWRGRVEGVFHL